MKLIQAKFPSRCATCGGNIEAGASIWFDGDAAKGNKAHHEACRAIPKDNKPAPAPAPAPMPAPAPAPAPIGRPCDKAFGNEPTMAAVAPVRSAREREHFADLQSFFAPRPMTAANKNELKRSLTRTSESKGGTTWFGLYSANDVIDAIRNGWPDGAKRMLEALGKIKTTNEVQSIRRVLVRDDHGDEFDIHRAYAGSFDKAWTRRKRGLRRTTKGVTVVLDACAPHTIGSDQLFWRGAAALCLCELLTEAGYSVSFITGARVIKLDDDTSTVDYQYSVTVKEAHQQLDIEALAAATALTGFFRCGGFKKIAERPYNITDTFGYPAALDVAALDAENPVLVPISVLGQQQAADWLAQTIAELTGEPAIA